MNIINGMRQLEEFMINSRDKNRSLLEFIVNQLKREETDLKIQFEERMHAIEYARDSLIMEFAKQDIEFEQILGLAPEQLKALDAARVIANGHKE